MRGGLQAAFSPIMQVCNPYLHPWISLVVRPFSSLIILSDLPEKRVNKSNWNLFKQNCEVSRCDTSIVMLSATTTTTVTIAPKAPTKLSWPAMSHCQWRDPELSIGTPLKPLGRHKCWSLKDKSQAAVLWKTLSRPIISLLEDQYEHLDAKDSELRVDMFMIGRKATSSIPTILFSCESKTPRRKAMDLVKKKGILDCHPGVQMAECSRLPRQLALGEDSELPLLPPGVYLDGPLRGCGIAVLISRDGIAPLRKATIGGIICIEDDYYGLTTAHAFDEAEEAGSSSDGDFEFAFYGPGQPADSSDDEDDFMTTSRGEEHSKDPRVLC